MKNKRIKYCCIICAAALLVFLGILSLNGTINFSKAGYVYSIDKIKTWTDNDSKLIIKELHNKEEFMLDIDASNLTSEKECFVADIYLNDEFKLSEKNVLSFEYEYSGNENLEIQLQLIDINGQLKNCATKLVYGVEEDKIYINTFSKEKVSLQAQSKTTKKVYVPIKSLSDKFKDKFYGIRITADVAKKDIGDLRISSINVSKDGIYDSLEKYKSVNIVGNENPIIPFLGTYWYDYTVSGVADKEYEFLLEDEIDGVTIDDSGKLCISSECNCKDVTFIVKLGDKLHTKKTVHLNDYEKDMIRVGEPGTQSKIEYPLSSMNKPSIKRNIRYGLMAILAVVIILAIWINIYIYFDKKRVSERGVV